jgi:hypothetical protein
MKYLNLDALRQIDGATFQNTKPFPWINPHGALYDEQFEKLRKTFPDVSLFTKSYGIERAYGQKPHDRWELFMRDGLPLSPEWKEFVEEIMSPEYRKELERIFGTTNFSVRYWWQRATTGASVSPHADSVKKLGTQIFYMNSSEDWQDAWGGKTIILDDEGKFPEHSAPELSSFSKKYEAQILGNRSLIFMRTAHAWHAVDELKAPEGAYRKLFTVILDRKPGLSARIAAYARKLFPALNAAKSEM